MWQGTSAGGQNPHLDLSIDHPHNPTEPAHPSPQAGQAAALSGTTEAATGADLGISPAEVSEAAGAPRQADFMPPTADPALSPSDPSQRRPYAAIASENYRLFASGFVCSSTGLQMLSAAVLWEVANRSPDPMAIGYVGLARALPVVLLALPAGHVVDSYRRERVLVITQIGMGTAAALLAVSSWMHWPLWVMYLILFGSGCARSLNGPTRSSLLPQLVPPEAFTNAVTWNSGIFQFAAIGGPLLAGVVMAATGLYWPVYALTAIGCSVLAVTGVFLRPRPGKKRAEGPPTLRTMAAGLGHVWREKTVLGTITLDLFAVLLGGVTALMPIYAKDILHVTEVGYGALRAAPFVGALLMAIVMAHSGPLRRAGTTLLWSVGLWGLCMIGFGLSKSLWLSLGLLAVSGALDNVSVVIRHVLVQMRTPEELRGRVSAVNSVFIESSNELGSFESSVVAKLFGPVVSAVSGGVGTLLVVLGIGLLFPQLRRLDRLEDER